MGSQSKLREDSYPRVGNSEHRVFANCFIIEDLLEFGIGTMLGLTNEKQESLCVFPGASPVLFCSQVGGEGGALVIPVEEM